MKLYNTMARGVQNFKSREPGHVKIFTCGPSIYRRPHIGNYRTFMYEDILVKYLEFLGNRVDRTINFTDVEDKTISEALEHHTSISDLTKAVEHHFFREAEILSLKLPTDIPRASTSVEAAVKVIQRLVEKKYAYWYEGNVYFDPLKKKDFGKLFRLDMSKWPKKRVRFKRDTYNGNRWNRGDFVLWHGHENTDGAVWDTELGRGRPSWNVQDPAMIVKTLGEQVDINCGGIDNIYRHHDYNIAIMEAYSGKPYANFYLHGQHLITFGEKMSKSKGNILYPDDVLKKGYKPHHLRFFLYYTHYRKKLNFTDDRFARTAAYLDRARATARDLLASGTKGAQARKQVDELVDALAADFQRHVDDDLSIGAGFDAVMSRLDGLATEKKHAPLAKAAVDRLEKELRRVDSVLGVLLA